MSNTLIKVLLVEDNRDYAWMLRLVLDEMNSHEFALVHVEQLKDALECLSEDRYDVILLDLSLPDSHGFNTFDKVYEIAADIPIVVTTAIDDKELAIKAVREGAQDYLVKGNTDINQLIRSIRYAVERHRTLTDLRRLSLVDDLTGLLNRRGFFSMADQHMKIAERSNRELLLFFADLDGLKQINDHYGHQLGDQALRETACILKETFRSSDLIARLGGDEFTVLAIDAPKHNAETIIHRLERNVSRFNAKNSQFQLSLSIGVARFDPQNSSDLDLLLAQADKALYRQKGNNHRNQVFHSIQ